MRLHALSRDIHRAGLALASVLISIFVITPVDAQAQDLGVAAAGSLTIRDWPIVRPPDAPRPDVRKFRLLPFVDSLTLGYRFAEVQGRPSMELGLEWTLGQEGILDGRRVDRAALPQRIIIESIELLAKVEVDGGVVADFFLPLDTVRLGPAPSVAIVDIQDVSWDNVFADAGEEETREIFEAGFTLHDLRIVRVVFATEHARTRNEDWDDDRTTVWVPDVDVWVGVSGRPRWRPPVTIITKATRDRRDEIGREDLVERERPDRGYDRAEGDKDDDASSDGDRSDRRKARRKGGKDADAFIPRKGGKKNDDDDDEDRLLPAALAGLAVVGGLAVLGGTFGYYGSLETAPIGLMAGRVEQRGGVLFHVAINRQVFGKEPGPENLIFGITGFRGPARSPVQPAVGLGLRITEEGTESTRTLLNVSVGAVANLDYLVVHLAYDFEAQDLRFGVGINLRARHRAE